MADREVPRLVENGAALDNTGLVHMVAVPESDGPHKCVVMIQGRKGNEEVMWVFAPTLPKEWLVIAPRAIEVEDDGYSWHPFMPYLPDIDVFDEAVGRLHQFIESLPALYGVDPDGIFLMGFSQGAALAFAYAIRYPDQIQGIAALMGFMPEGYQSILEKQPLARMPVFMAAGKEDDTIPLHESQRSAQTALDAGADLTYGEYETGHKLNRQATRELREWWEARLTDG